MNAKQQLLNTNLNTNESNQNKRLKLKCYLIVFSFASLYLQTRTVIKHLRFCLGTGPDKRRLGPVFERALGTCVINTLPLKLFIHRRVIKSFFFSLVSFSLVWFKTKRSYITDGKYIIRAIHLLVREGVKYLDSVKLKNNSYYILCRINVPNILGIQTRYTLPSSPTCKYIAQVGTLLSYSHPT